MPKVRPAHTLAQAQTMVDGSFIPEALEARALEVLEQAMGATAYVRGPRGSGEGIQYVSVPDHAIRVVAAVKVIEWRRGKPTQQLNVNSVPSGRELPKPGDVFKLMAANPALTEKILSSIVESAKVVEVVDKARTCDTPKALPSESESGGPQR